MMTLKEVCGLDETPCRMLKDQIKYQLNFINCQHVIRFKVSEDCKIAKVTPIFKKGKKIQNQKNTNLFHFCL